MQNRHWGARGRGRSLGYVAILLGAGCSDGNEPARPGGQGDAGADASLDASRVPDVVAPDGSGHERPEAGADAGILVDIESPSAIAVLSGACFLSGEFSQDFRKCDGYDAFTDCAFEKCDAVSCASACKEYVACAGTAGHDCGNGCAESEACGACLARMFTCTTFDAMCAAKIQCDVPLAPGGPCEQVLACCNSLADAGDARANCLRIIDLGKKLLGDPVCKEAQEDPGSYCITPCFAPEGGVPPGLRPECAGFPASYPYLHDK